MDSRLDRVLALEWQHRSDSVDKMIWSGVTSYIDQTYMYIFSLAGQLDDSQFDKGVNKLICHFHHHHTSVRHFELEKVRHKCLEAFNGDLRQI